MRTSDRIKAIRLELQDLEMSDAEAERLGPMMNTICNGLIALAILADRVEAGTP